MLKNDRLWSLIWAWADRIVACLSTRSLSGYSGYLTRSIFSILMRFRTWAGSLSYLPSLGSYSYMLRIKWPPCKLEDNLHFGWCGSFFHLLPNLKTSHLPLFTFVGHAREHDTFPSIYYTSSWSVGKYNQIYWSPHPSLSLLIHRWPILNRICCSVHSGGERFNTREIFCQFIYNILMNSGHCHSWEEETGMHREGEK